MQLFNRGKALVLALALALVASIAPTAAFATGPAVPSATAVVDYIEALAVPIGLVGAAILLLVLGIKAYKWMRRAM